MNPLTGDNFGLLIAYLLPGFVVLVSFGPFSETMRSWLGADPTIAPSVGGFLYLTLGSTAAGLVVSAARWLLLDRLFHWTGIPEPRWDFARFPDRFHAFEGLVQNHYRYYQFYANMLVALVLAYGVRLIALRRFPGDGSIADLAIPLVVVVLFFGSRDTLRKYYERASQLLDAREQYNAIRYPKSSPGGASDSSSSSRLRD